VQAGDIFSRFGSADKFGPVLTSRAAFGQWLNTSGGTMDPA
jgi:hypothetical protein